MTDQTNFLTRRELAARWGTSLRTINRLRDEMGLPWVDLAQGRRKKPIIRFRASDVAAFEEQGLHRGIDDVNPNP